MILSCMVYLCCFCCCFFATQEYQQSDTTGQNAILLKLHESGMKSLTWATSMDQTYDTVEKTTDATAHGMFTRLPGCMEGFYIFTFCSRLKLIDQVSDLEVQWPGRQLP